MSIRSLRAVPAFGTKWGTIHFDMGRLVLHIVSLFIPKNANVLPSPTYKRSKKFVLPNQC